MNTIGQRLYRPLSSLMMVLLVLVLAAPQGGVAAQAGAPQSDDFNICSLNTGLWVFENPANISEATPEFTGAYTGDAHVTMTLPPGQTITFSDTNQDAPRLMQAISDASFEVETRFIAPMNTNDDNYKMMGILVRDSSVTPARWLRFDFNSHNGGLNAYAGFMNGSARTNLLGPVDLPGTNPTEGALTLRVKYDEPTNAWTVTWFVGDSSATDTRVFNLAETTLGIDFVPTHIGVFVGSTTGIGTPPGSPPGNTMVVDYFHNLANPLTDDGVVLTVNKAGTGLGNVNQTCSGNQVTLTAAPVSGSTFENWTGDVSPSPNPNPTITLDMTLSRTVTANFGGSAPALDFSQFMPVIHR